MIGIIGDYDPNNRTHQATSQALGWLPSRTAFEWIPTDELSSGSEDRFRRFGGFFIAPSSPYRNMEGALEAIRFARERGVPLVGT